MRQFVQLFRELNQTNSTLAKREAMARSFRESDSADAMWMLYFLVGKKLKPIVSSKQLRAWAAEISDIPIWLVERSYEIAGDLAETLALVLPNPKESNTKQGEEECLRTLVEEVLIPLRERSDASKYEVLKNYWSKLDADECFIFNKLITGGLRIGVSRTLVEKALSQAYEIPQSTITHRLTGDWEPDTAFWNNLIDPSESAINETQPYAFFLAHPLEARSVPKEGERTVPILEILKDLGPIDEWQIEWKWDGIRSQIVKRQDSVMLWSRGEERVHEMFPEIAEAAQQIPGSCVIDGEIVAWSRSGVGSFSDLQHRLGRKKPSRNVQEKYPCAFIAYDILEYDFEDIRERGLFERRMILEEKILKIQEALKKGSSKIHSEEVEQYNFFDTLDPIIHETESEVFRCSEVLDFKDWKAAFASHAEARRKRVEGYMLKKCSSPYRSGRVKGDWWKWKTDPYTVDCVMLYAQAGHGRRAGLYTDFTFGVLHEDELLPFTKAYSGLTNEEFRKVDAWIKKNTLAKRGPIRTVKPELVFEVAFENIHYSKRHKAGIALRFPRIARWRKDKSPDEIDTLENLRQLIEVKD